MAMLSGTLSKLPFEIVAPLVLLIFVLPLFKLFNQALSSSRQHNRENLEQLVKYLEKYSEKKDKIATLAVEEAAQSRYRKPLSISEIEYFLNKDNAANQLYKYSQNKPRVSIKNDGIVLSEPINRIFKFFSFSLSWRELKGFMWIEIDGFFWCPKFV